MDQKVTRVRLLLGSAALCCLLVVPIALAGDARGPEAKSSLNVKTIKKKVNKLTNKVQNFKQDLAALEEQAKEPAGGDLTGTYPDPLIAPNAVNSGKVAVDSLTGADVNESTLGLVPLAVQANFVGASRIRIVPFSRVMSTGSLQTLFSIDKLVVQALCLAAEGQVELSASKTSGTPTSFIRGQQGSTNLGMSPLPIGSYGDETGSLAYAESPLNPASVITATWASDVLPVTDTCTIAGTAIG